MSLLSFLKEIRSTLFEVRLDREIYNRLFPHLLSEADHGYPFHSDEDMEALCKDPAITALPFVREIENDIRRMPDGYRKCFRYILHRELSKGPMCQKRMRWYRLLAKKNIEHDNRDPRLAGRALHLT
jgi:hypothetical protein